MILVTGGTGLLGSHLLFELSKSNVPIRALYRNSKRIQRVKALFEYYDREKGAQQFDRIDWFEGDILDIPALENSLEQVTHVYHCAGMVSFATRDFKDVMKINREGTANVVNCCLALNIQKLCYVSSTAAVGYTEQGLTDESILWKNGPDVSGYSVSKYSAEKEVWRGIEEGLCAVMVNPCVIFGPGNWDETSLAIFRSVHKGLKFYTPGANSIVDARDVARIMVNLMESDIHGERFLCTGENITFKELTARIALRLGKTPPSIQTPRWLAGLGWRIAAAVSLFTGKKPAITKDTVASAYKTIQYNSDKVKQATGIEFTSLDDTIENAILGRLE
ncbi:MAG: hypothetical protein RIT43_920 [Bacteroidota bacterium]|jgi:nucleoside-diphosphate-sugar epimerase